MDIGDSNEHPQYMFWITNKKYRYIPANPSFSLYNWGLSGMNISLTCFPDEHTQVFPLQSGQVKARDSHSSPELTNHNGAHPFRKFNLNPDTPAPEVEWSIIGSHQMKGTCSLFYM